MLWTEKQKPNNNGATTVWQDSAKFCHFGTMLKHFGNFESANLIFAKFLSLFW